MGLSFIRNALADLHIWYFIITHCIRFEKYSVLSKRLQISNINLAQKCFHVCTSILKFILLPTTIFGSQLGWMYKQYFTCLSSSKINWPYNLNVLESSIDDSCFIWVIIKTHDFILTWRSMLFSLIRSYYVCSLCNVVYNLHIFFLQKQLSISVLQDSFSESFVKFFLKKKWAGLLPDLLQACKWFLQLQADLYILVFIQ